MDYLNKNKKELHTLGLSTQGDLVEIVKPLIINTLKVCLNQPIQMPENSQFLSHFSGQPYFEKGESWPTTGEGQPLDFIFQWVNPGTIEILGGIQVLQFYYDWESIETADEGWLIKTYKQINKEKNLFIEKPAELGRRKYREMMLSLTKTLPDWQSLDLYQPLVSKLASLLNEDPWEAYQQVVEKLLEVREEKDIYFSRIGGYPIWIQGDETPVNQKGQPMKLLFQLDSEGEFMWGDCGSVYVFYDPHNIQHFEFVMQCH